MSKIAKLVRDWVLGETQGPVWDRDDYAKGYDYGFRLADTIYEIAEEIRRDWKKVYFGAVPYLDAMAELNTMASRYGCDSAQEIVLYFLSNASTWKGETAKRVKAKLESILKWS